MGAIWQSLLDFLVSTEIPEQLAEVDWRGLSSNPWFMVPLVAQLGWWVYKQAVNAIVFTLLGIGVWVFTGTEYASGLVIDGVVQIGKILPVAGVGLGAIMVIIYLVFMRE